MKSKESKGNKRLVICSYTTAPFCCGVISVGNFRDFEKDDRNIDLYRRAAWGMDQAVLSASNWTDLLKDVRSENEQHPLTFEFVRRRDVDQNFGYNPQNDHQEFLDLIYEQPDHLFLYEFTNPNSGNIVTMVMLKNGGSNE